jgi:HD superfamily phosphodiesterase
MTVVEQSDIITAAEDHVRHIFEQKIPSDIYTYHNWVHTTQVVDEVLVLARQAGITNGELEIVNIAALFHDVGFSKHTQVMRTIASGSREIFLLPKLSTGKIDAITRLIEVTKWMSSLGIKWNPL